MEIVITSPQNERVRMVRALHRRRQRHRVRRFLAEGTRLIEDGLDAGVRPEIVFYTQELAETEVGHDLLVRLRDERVPIALVPPSLMAEMADTTTPQGILAVFPFVEWPDLPAFQFVLIADRVRDPGNLGTILRSALAAGVDQVWLAPGTVDAYSPKVVRAGMGTHFRLPILSLSWAEIEERGRGMQIVLADVRGDVAYTEVTWRWPVALIVGGEAEGASEEAFALAEQRVYIPMPGPAESLNVAVATGVILFEVARRRGEARTK